MGWLSFSMAVEHGKVLERRGQRGKKLIEG